MDKLGKQYGFLNKSGELYFQFNYPIYSRKLKQTVSKTKSIPLKNDSDRIDNSGISKQQFVGVITAFRNELTNRVVECPNLISLQVADKMGVKIPKRDTNHDNFYQLQIGEVFYEFDISKAFFQSAFKTGYISEKFYNKYKDKDSLKQPLREAVTWLARDIRKTYYNVGEEDPREGYTIRCGQQDRSQYIYNKIFSNIRNYLHNTILDCLNEVGLENYIKYNIDAIVVEDKYTKKVEDVLNAYGWKYTKEAIGKISETQYITTKAQIKNI